jgi:hypothetical protein
VDDRVDRTVADDVCDVVGRDVGADVLDGGAGATGGAPSRTASTKWADERVNPVPQSASRSVKVVVLRWLSVPR